MRTIIVLILLASALFLLFPAVCSAQDSFFDIWTEMSVLAAPPYPNSGHQGVLAHMDASGLTVDGEHSVILSALERVGTGEPHASTMRAGDSGSGVGGFSVDSFFDITYAASSDTTVVDICCIDSFFDITFSYNHPGNGGFASLAPLNPNFPPDDDRRYFNLQFFDSFFDITYEVDFNSSAGHRLALHGSVPPELRITNVQVLRSDPSSADSFFDVFVEVNVQAPVSIGTSILRIDQTGQFVMPAVPDRETSWGKVKSLYR